MNGDRETWHKFVIRAAILLATLGLAATPVGGADHIAGVVRHERHHLRFVQGCDSIRSTHGASIDLDLVTEQAGPEGMPAGLLRPPSR